MFRHRSGAANDKHICAVCMGGEDVYVCKKVCELHCDLLLIEIFKDLREHFKRLKEIIGSTRSARSSKMKMSAASCLNSVVSNSQTTMEHWKHSLMKLRMWDATRQRKFGLEIRYEWHNYFIY